MSICTSLKKLNHIKVIAMKK